MREKKEIYRTRDYSRFNRIDGNRNVDDRIVSRLVESIEERNLLSVNPILVTKDYHVIDGQHRLTAAESLGTYIYYIVQDNLTLEDVQALNKTKRVWSLTDHVNSYIEMGNEDYSKLRKFSEKHRLGVGTSARLLAGSSTTPYKNLKSGLFKVKREKEAEELVEKLNEFQPYYKGYRRRTFVTAFIKVTLLKSYDHGRMISQLKKQPSSLTDCLSIRAYLGILEEIYNWHARNKLGFIYGERA